MTTGSQNVDLRQPVPWPYGTLYTGIGYKKTWTGTDKPILRRPRRILHPAFESSQRKRNGKPYVIPAYYSRDPAFPEDRTEHPFSMEYVKETGTPTYWNYQQADNIGNRGVTNCSVSELGYATDPWGANDDIILVNRLRARLHSDWDPAVFLATSRQSLQLIGSTALRLSGVLRDIRAGRLADAARLMLKNSGVARKAHRNGPRPVTTKDLAEAQLELSYGILPLVNDAYEGARYVAHNIELPKRASARVTRRVKFPLETSTPSNYRHTSSSFGEHRAQLIARIEESGGPLYLLGLDDPLSMAWEALPFSFVADWFIPIQNYLMARSFANATSAVYVTTHTVVRQSFGIERVPPSLYTYIGPYTGRSVSVSRSVSASLGVKLPVFKPFASVPSYRRCINAVSLLVARHGSSVPLLDATLG